MGGKVQRARHAQMPEKTPLVQMHEQILAPPIHANHPEPGQIGRLGAQRPAQGLAHAQKSDASALDAFGKAQASDFDFGQFWHGVKYWVAVERPVKPCDYDLFVMTLIQHLLSCALALGAFASWAQPNRTPPPSSGLTGELMFEILLGEMQVLQGDPGAGYSLLLDAARKSSDEALYDRAVDVALRARAGDAALRAAAAWRQAFPQSRKANQRVLQIQVALQRLRDAQYSLSQELRLAPEEDRGALMLSIPGLLNRAADKKLATQVTEQALTEWLNDPKLGPQAWTAVGQMRLQSQDLEGALQAAQQGLSLNPQRTEPLWLGIELARTQTQAQTWVSQNLALSDDPALHQGWARVMIELGQLEQAERTMTVRVQKNPKATSAWFVLGAIRQELKNPKGASEAWQRFLKETEAHPERKREREQALLGLAQLSLDDKQDDQATHWLSQVGDGDNAMRALSLRATILGRQGKVTEGRQLIATRPVRTVKQEQERTMAEVQYLRQFKQWQAAYDLLSVLVAKIDDDNDDLDYELAMAAEKVGKVQEMETLLRGIIERNPKYHHAYNALGFSLADRNVRLDEAKQLIIKSLEFAPDDPYITDSLGWVEFRLGRLPEAEAILRRAFEAKPDAEIAAHWGEVLWTLGQKNRALEVWRHGLKLGADNETLQDTLKRLGVKP